MRKWYRILLILVVLGASIGSILGTATPVLAVADRYWVGNAGNWDQTSHWSTSSGGAGGASVPNSGNDVHFDGASFTLANQSIILSTASHACRNLDFTGSGVDTPIFQNLSGSNPTDLSIYGTLTMENGWTWDANWSGNDGFSFHSAGTLNPASYVIPHLTLSSGAVTLGANTVVKSFTAAGGTLTTGGFTLTSQAGFAGNGQTYADTIILNNALGDGVVAMTGANTFNNLTISNDSKHDEVTVNANQTINGTLTFSGTSATNRLFFRGNDTTQRTITAAVVSSAYTDFYSIIGAGAGSWDLAAAGEDAIDFTNCSGITFAWPYSSSRDYYWTGHDGSGGTGYWDSGFPLALTRTYYNWSSTSNGVGGAQRLPNPTAGNNVYFDSNSGFTVGNQTVTISGSDTINSVNDLDFTGSSAIAAPIIANLSGSYYTYMDIYGDLTLVAGMTGTNGDAWYLKGSGNLTTAGVSFNAGFGNFVVASSGTYVAQDDIYIDGTRTFTHTSGTLDTVTNSATIYYTGTGSSNFAGGGLTQTYYRLYDTRNGTTTITGSNNFVNLYRQGTASYTDGLKFAADQYITNLDLHGFSQIYRLQFGSSVAGTQRQCSVSGLVDVTNTDLSDSAKVGAGDPDITAGNNSDFGGNLGWIFDTGYYIYWVGNSGVWSDLTNHWSSTSGGAPGTGRVPLIQDIAVFDENSFSIPGRTVTIDITNLSGIDASAVTNSPTITKSGTIDIYGDVNIGTLAAWTVTTTNFKGLETALESDTTLTTNMYVLKNAGFMSSLYLSGNLAISGTLYVQSGVFNHNGFNLTAAVYDSATTTYDRQILLGSGTTILNSAGAVTKWNMNATKLTLTCGESTIILTNSGASAQTFAGASLVYNNVTVAGAGAYALTVSGTNTIGTLTIDRSLANKTLTGSVTITISDAGGLVLDTSGTRTITITNTDFTMASGVVFGDYLVISGSAAGGGGTFFANVGGHSTNSGGNSGWIWTPPTAPTIQTNDATDVTYLGERLNGQLLTAGSYVVFYCYFEYGPTVAYGFTTPETTLTGAGSFNQYLSPYKVYHYRAVVRFGLNDHAYGNDKTVSLSGAVGQAKAAVSDPGQSAGTALVGAGDVPAQPARMYAEGNTAGIPIAPAINDALAETNTPEAAFWYPIAFLIALLLGFGAFGMTRSLLVQALVSGCVMAAFAGGGTLGDGLLPFWTVIVFLIEGVLIWLIQEKQNI